MLGPVASVIALAAMPLIGGCAAKKVSKARGPFPALERQDASLATAAGVSIVSKIEMPPGLELLPSPAVWLRSGRELAVVGNYQGRTVVLALGGSNYQESRAIIQDQGTGPAAAKILDLAAAPDGSALLVALHKETQGQVEILLAAAEPSAKPREVASFSAAGASLAWLGADTIAVALSTTTPDGTLEHPAPGTAELHIMRLDGGEVSKDISLPCGFGRLHWNFTGAKALVEPLEDGPPKLLTLNPRACAEMPGIGKIRFLQWAPKADAFLFVDRLPAINNPAGIAVFEYNAANGAKHPMVLASGAAAYIKDGRVAVLGSQQINPRLLATQPDAWITAELGLIDSQNSEMRVKTLVAKTLPLLLPQSSIAYASGPNQLAVEFAIPGQPVNPYLVVSFDVASEAAGLVAERTAPGAVLPSWAPQGGMLALLDPFSKPATVTILALPR